jgi:hypothetical protein
MNVQFMNILTVLLMEVALSGCAAIPPAGKQALAPTDKATVPRSPISSASKEKRYLFYLYEKIIEDQGIPAISPECGEYQHQAILDRLSGSGFEIISEKRPKNTEVLEMEMFSQYTIPWIHWPDRARIFFQPPLTKDFQSITKSS